MTVIRTRAKMGKTGKKKKKKRKEQTGKKNETENIMYARRAQAESGEDKVVLCGMSK